MASQSTTTTLSQQMSIFYDKLFLERAMLALRYDFGATKKTLPLQAGKTIYFNRMTPLAVATTAITEGTTPSAVSMSSTIVSATVAQYGTYTAVSDLFSLTSIDVGLKEHVAVMAQNAGETIDTLIAAELSGNTTNVQYANGKVALSSLAITDTLTGAEIRKAVRTLKVAKARMFPEGMFRAIVPAAAAYDLRGSTEWQNSLIYTDSSDYKKGVLGSIHGVRFVETNNQITESSTVTVYHTYVFGDGAYVMINLEGQADQRIFVKNPGPSDTSNPIDVYSTVGWKVNFVAKTLNSSWIVIIKSGVSA
jgi:N4-gp56 family major capsid protein